jgi:hypothetical protein
VHFLVSNPGIRSLQTSGPGYACFSLSPLSLSPPHSPPSHKSRQLYCTVCTPPTFLIPPARAPISTSSPSFPERSNRSVSFSSRSLSLSLPHPSPLKHFGIFPLIKLGISTLTVCSSIGGERPPKKTPNFTKILTLSSLLFSSRQLCTTNGISKFTHSVFS